MLSAIDTIFIDTLIVDELIPISGSGGNFIISSKGSSFLAIKKDQYKLKRIAIENDEDIIPPSTSAYNNLMGWNLNQKYWIFDLEEEKYVKSFKHDRKNNALINYSFQDYNYIYLINYYPNDVNKKKGYDFVKIYKYSKSKQKIVSKTTLDIGPEVFLSSMGYQLATYDGQYFYVATTLSGRVYKINKKLKVVKEFIVNKELYQENKEFIDSFFSNEKIATYQFAPKRVITAFRSQIDSSGRVLNKIIPADDGNLILSYTNPKTLAVEIFKYYEIRDKLKKVNTDTLNVDPFYFTRHIETNNYNEMQAVYFKASSSGNYYVILNYVVIEETDQATKESLQIPDNIDLFNSNGFILLSPDYYCAGCYSNIRMNNIIYFAPISWLKGNSETIKYLKKKHAQDFNVKGTLIYLDDENWSRLIEMFQIGKLYFFKS